MGKRHSIILIICVFSLLAVSLFVGTSYARYVSEITKMVGFEANTLINSGTVKFESNSGWVSTQNGQKIEFTLSGENRQASPRRVSVRISATQMLDPNVVIKLVVGGSEYVAKPSAIANGSALYKKMGGGTLYKFFNGDSELTFDLIEQTNMTVTVEGKSDAALLRLCVDEI